jgi:hypothetical protein
MHAGGFIDPSNHVRNDQCSKILFVSIHHSWGIMENAFYVLKRDMYGK